MSDADVPVEIARSYREAGFWTDLTLAEAMRRMADERPEAILHLHSDSGSKQAALAELHAAGRKLAASLKALGVGPGDTIAMQLPNSLENAIFIQAAAWLGCTLLPIVHIFGPHELSHILADSGATVLIVPDRWRNFDYIDRVERLPALPKLRHRIVIGKNVPDWALAFANLPDGGDIGAAENPAETALLLYTSGTTAAPKGVRHTARGLLAEILVQRESRPVEEVTLSPWPSGHIAGTLGMLGHALLGRPLVLMEIYDPAAAAELVDRFGITQTSGTPFHLAGMMDAAKRDGRDLSTLRQYVIGATTVPPPLVAASEALGIRCCRCYGSTELPSFSQCEPEDPLEKRLNTDGKLNPGCELRLVDDMGEDVPDGAEGELAVRGPERFAGYTDEALNRSSFLPGGWFLTGDIGRLDSDGFLTITDRKKDIIIRGGENISSREVEELLLNLSAVREAAAIGMADERMGERVCAVVVLHPGAVAPELAEIDRTFRSLGVARQKTPEHLIVVEDFPRTPTGKIQKAELRALLVQAGKIAVRKV